MTDPIDLEAIEKRLAAIVLPTESDPHLYRLDPTEGCWIAYKPVDCVGEEELPERPTDLAALVAEVKRLRATNELLSNTAVSHRTSANKRAARLDAALRENKRLRNLLKGKYL